MTPDPRSWRLARWWLVRVLPARAAADVIGDLREDADRERARRSALRLELWLLRETWLRPRGGSGGLQGRGALVALQIGLALALLLCAAART